MGGIVAGAVVGGVAITSIIAFAWYKVQTHRSSLDRATTTPPPPLPASHEQISQPSYMEIASGQVMGEDSDHRGTSIRDRYPETL